MNVPNSIGSYWLLCDSHNSTLSPKGNKIKFYPLDSHSAWHWQFRWLTDWLRLKNKTKIYKNVQKYKCIRMNRVNLFICRARLCVLSLPWARIICTQTVWFFHVTFHTVCINLWALSFQYFFSVQQYSLTLLHMTIHLHCVSIKFSCDCTRYEMIWYYIWNQ